MGKVLNHDDTDSDRTTETRSPQEKTGQDQQYQPKAQSGKTLNSTISTHNNYNNLIVQEQTNRQENQLHNLIHQQTKQRMI